MAPDNQFHFLETLYSGLAQAFASPGAIGLPAWMAEPGTEWPYYEEAIQLATGPWAQAAAALEAVPASSLPDLAQQYDQLFVGPAHPPIWLYEAWYLDGRVLGPSSFTVSGIYKEYGLEVEGSELPDHASLELAFLEHLVHQESLTAVPSWSKVWRTARQAFIKDHAGLWLPGVGKALIASGYPAWAAIGYLLLAGLSPDEIHPKVKKTPVPSPRRLIPFVELPDQCIFCGFCVQICPSHALVIREDRQHTRIELSIPTCIHCNKCERVCPVHVIQMIPGQVETGAPPEGGAPLTLLVESERVACPSCGEPTVSRAELDYVIKCIGHPNWLDYCLNCRSSAQNSRPNSGPANTRE